MKTTAYALQPTIAVPPGLTRVPCLAWDHKHIFERNHVIQCLHIINSWPGYANRQNNDNNHDIGLIWPEVWNYPWIITAIWQIHIWFARNILKWIDDTDVFIACLSQFLSLITNCYFKNKIKGCASSASVFSGARSLSLCLYCTTIFLFYWMKLNKY